MQIAQFLKQATEILTNAGITSARLDALILLEDTLGRERAWLLAHQDELLSSEQLLHINGMLARRAQREPLAYIRGVVEFYGRPFNVTPEVLIPRPETERLIEQIKNISIPPQSSILDVGTGSGAIAITTALELSNTRLNACDISPAALQVAAHNARSLEAQVSFFQSDLLDQAGIYELIIANLPYVSQEWQRSPETTYEPALALFAADHGLELIKTLICQAADHLTTTGHLLLEADRRQLPAISEYAVRQGFKTVKKDDFLIHLQKV